MGIEMKSAPNLAKKEGQSANITVTCPVIMEHAQQLNARLR